MTCQFFCVKLVGVFFCSLAWAKHIQITKFILLVSLEPLGHVKQAKLQEPAGGRSAMCSAVNAVCRYVLITFSVHNQVNISIFHFPGTWTQTTEIYLPLQWIRRACHCPIRWTDEVVKCSLVSCRLHAWHCKSFSLHAISKPLEASFPQLWNFLAEHHDTYTHLLFWICLFCIS
jgi:hypothetical protein